MINFDVVSQYCNSAVVLKVCFEMQTATMHSERILAVQSLKQTHCAFFKPLWKIRELHWQVKLRSHGQHHCYMQPIACATPNCQRQLVQQDHDCRLLQERTSHSASKSDTLGHLKAPALRCRGYPQAKPLCTCSGEPLCTLQLMERGRCLTAAPPRLPTARRYAASRQSPTRRRCAGQALGPRAQAARRSHSTRRVSTLRTAPDSCPQRPPRALCGHFSLNELLDPAKRHGIPSWRDVGERVSL